MADDRKTFDQKYGPCHSREFIRRFGVKWGAYTKEEALFARNWARANRRSLRNQPPKQLKGIQSDKTDG